MSNEFIERDGFRVQEVIIGNTRTLYLVGVFEGLTEHRVIIGEWSVDAPHKYGEYRRSKMLIEALVRSVDLGATSDHIMADARRVLSALQVAGEPTIGPTEPWYLWIADGSQAVYRNDESKEVLVVTKHEWHERMPISDYYDLMEGLGDEAIHASSGMPATAKD